MVQGVHVLLLLGDGAMGVQIFSCPLCSAALMSDMIPILLYKSMIREREREKATMGRWEDGKMLQVIIN
jgi:hypothetical protein